VVGLDTFLYEGCDFGRDEVPIAALRRDVRDVRPSELEGFDAVVHLAGLSNDPLGALDPELTEEVNFRATVRLAETAKAAGVPRFLFASSCSMYGITGGDRPIDEAAPLKPLTAYAGSKARAEDGLVHLADTGFSPVLMRNATAYGVSPRLRIDLVLNNLVGWAVTTGAVLILSDGTPWRPLVHVRDIAAATVALLEAPREVVHCEAFNVGRDDENYQVRELAEIARAAVGDCRIEYAGSGDPDSRSYRVDFGKLARVFPTLSLSWTAAAGARELADAYRADGMTIEEFESPRYTRLKRLQASLETGKLDSDLRWSVAV
ncbi:MAG: SDR family oxidoreductase, partial [Actinobacteria bacterium]|nr:SDR family oxidoreductase [Actinomycetota bacterium]